MTTLLIEIALAIALAGAFAFAILFTATTEWRTTSLGRHFFYFAWAFVLAFATNLLRVWVKAPWVDVARVASLFLVAFVFWQRVYLLARSLRRDA